MSRPEMITLSAAAGEAIIERLAVYAPSRSDCEILIPDSTGLSGKNLSH